MLHLDKNENMYGPSEKCKKVIQNMSLEMFNSYSRGYPKIIIKRLEKEFKVPGNNILIGYGSEDILKQIFYFVGNHHKKKKVLLPLQGWWYYSSIAKEINAEILYYDLIEKKKSFDYNADKIIEIMHKEKPSIVLICSPNNPTGNSIKKSDLKKILKKSEQTNSVIVLDEAYWGFNENSNKSIKWVKDFKNMITLRTFSKFYALAGMRIGFGFVGSNLKELIKFNLRYLGYNRISEELTFAALDSKNYYKKIARLIEKDKKRYYNELEKLGLKVYRSNANFILVRIPPDFLPIIKEEFEKEGVLIRYFNEGMLKDTIRITIGTVEQNDIVIDLFKDIIKRKI